MVDRRQRASRYTGLNVTAVKACCFLVGAIKRCALENIADHVAVIPLVKNWKRSVGIHTIPYVQPDVHSVADTILVLLTRESAWSGVCWMREDSQGAMVSF